MIFTVAAEPGAYIGRLRVHAIGAFGPQDTALCGYSTTGLTIVTGMPWEATHPRARCLLCDHDVRMWRPPATNDGGDGDGGSVDT